jgi:hypothetical protein
MISKRFPYVLMLLTLAATIFAQTEFYLSSMGITAPNGCQALKDTLPIHCPINSEISITGVVWNPDSIDWCTKEGYYRSIDISHPPVWKIDDVIYSSNVSNNGFSITIPVLDTLEHIITAAYLQFPVVSIHYKGENNKLPVLLCSNTRKLFASDSLHMTIQSAFSVFFNNSSEMPVVREDSARNNPALLTYCLPSDTSIKLTTFLCNHKNTSEVSDFKCSYSPSLNSYSILIPLTNIQYLCKKLKQKSNSIDYVNDTIFAVFKKQSDYDTAKVLFSIPQFLLSKVDDKIQYMNKSLDVGSNKGMAKIYDLRGRVTNSYTFNRNYIKNLSSGTYIWQIKTSIIKQEKSR